VTAAEPDNRQDFDALPAAYAAWRRSMLGRITDALEQDLILDLVGPPAGLRILDVGCGDGILALELSRQGAHAVGVDTSEGMIAAARKRAKLHGDNVYFDIAKAEALPFATDCFDVVVAVTVLCFVEDAAVALKEMARVLKPGGRLIVGELGRHSAWAALRRIKGWLGSPVWRHARFRSTTELKQRAREAGLIDVSVHGAIYYPPFGKAARLFAPLDRKISGCTTTGAAFLALVATKPRDLAAEVSPSTGGAHH
jgi:ubiquinone biosynthesis O-methyltransferase